MLDCTEPSDGGTPCARVASWLAFVLFPAILAVAVLVVVVHSVRALWSTRVERVLLVDGSVFLGFRLEEMPRIYGSLRVHYLVHGSRPGGSAGFCWLDAKDIISRDYPSPAMTEALLKATVPSPRLDQAIRREMVHTSKTGDHDERLQQFRVKWRPPDYLPGDMLAEKCANWETAHRDAMTKHARQRLLRVQQRRKWTSLSKKDQRQNLM